MTANAIFIDTNILVYTHDLRYPDKQQRATELITRLVRERRGVISTQVLAECHNALTKRIPLPLTLEEAATRLRNYAESLIVIPITPQIVLRAADITAQHRLSYWDGQIIAAAQVEAISVVLSEDMASGAIIEGVRIRSPFSKDFDLAGL